MRGDFRGASVMTLFLTQSSSFGLYQQKSYAAMRHNLAWNGVGQQHRQHQQLHLQLKKSMFRGMTVINMQETSSAAATVSNNAPRVHFVTSFVRRLAAALISIFFVAFSSIGPKTVARAASGSSFGGSTFSSAARTSRGDTQRTTSRSSHSSRGSWDIGGSGSTSRDRYHHARHIRSGIHSTESGTAMGISVGPSTVFFARPSNVLLQICAIVGVTIFLAPHVCEVMVAKSGVKAAAVSEVQYLLRLSRNELAFMLASLQQTLATDGIELSAMMEAVSSVLLRQEANIVGGGMRQLRLKYEGGFPKAQDTFQRVSIGERVKFEEEPTCGIVTSTSPASSSSSSSSLSSSSSSSSSVLAVVTILLLTRGPVLRNRGWNNFHRAGRRTQVLKQEDLIDFLLRLTGYMRSMDVRQDEYFRRRDRVDMDSDSSSPPGLEIKVLWTPNSSTETITEAELRESWPSIRMI